MIVRLALPDGYIVTTYDAPLSTDGRMRVQLWEPGGVRPVVDLSRAEVDALIDGLAQMEAI